MILLTLCYAQTRLLAYQSVAWGLQYHTMSTILDQLYLWHIPLLRVRRLPNTHWWNVSSKVFTILDCLSTLLRHLDILSPSFLADLGENKDLTLKTPSGGKLVLLMASVSASRMSALQALDLTFRLYKPEGVLFKLSSLTKKKKVGTLPNSLGPFPRTRSFVQWSVWDSTREKL